MPPKGQQLDASIAGYAHESGRSMITLLNKWDLVIAQGADGAPTKSSRMQETSDLPAPRCYEQRLRDAW